MEALAQPGIFTVCTTGAGRHLAQLALPAPLRRLPSIHWAIFAVLLLLAAAVVALLVRLRIRARILKRENEAAASELKMLRTLFANLPDTLYVKDAESRFLMANQSAAANVGAARPADVLGKTDFDFFPRGLAEEFFADEQRVLLSGLPQISKEEQIKEADGKTRHLLTTKIPLFDAAGNVLGIVGVGRNISAMKEVEEELRRTREELQFKATHDSLTGLLNRGAILEMLERELARGVRDDGHTAVLLGDLDHFKKINDSYGHPVGDEVLRETACRLLKTVRAYDLVGRYGGEEFLIVLSSCTATDAMARAGQLRKAISASPIMTAQSPIAMTISIGILVTQEWGQPTTAEILREVDTALYAAKAAGRNRCTLAVPSAKVSLPWEGRVPGRASRR